MKSKSNKTLPIITGVVTLGYLLIIAAAFFQGSLSFSKLIDIFLIVLLLILLAGFALSWTRKKMAGIMLMAWNAGIWIYDIYLVREMDYSMLSAITSSVMVIGALFMLEWFKTTRAIIPSVQQQWKFILRVLILNYTVLYFIVVLSELVRGETVEYLSFPFIIYPLLLLIFLVGFLLSWKKEYHAGLIFLFWCAILVFGNVAYSELRQLGPWALFGFPILLQGLFYLKNHQEFRAK